MISKNQALKKLKEDIILRGFSQHTLRSYVTHVRIFLEFCGKPVEEVDEKDIRKFLLHLAADNERLPQSINIYSAAIRFFFAVTLNKTLNYMQIPRMKKPKSLPAVLSREDAGVLISSCGNIKHKSWLLLGYGSGLRAGEIVSLKVKDIDSKAMRIFVKGGKGKKDRYTILSEKLLLVLRDYWKAYRPQSAEGYLFPGSKNIGHITTSAVQRSVAKTLKNTVINK